MMSKERFERFGPSFADEETSAENDAIEGARAALEERTNGQKETEQRFNIRQFIDEEGTMIGTDMLSSLSPEVRDELEAERERGQQERGNEGRSLVAALFERFPRAKRTVQAIVLSSIFATAASPEVQAADRSDRIERTVSREGTGAVEDEVEHVIEAREIETRKAQDIRELNAEIAARYRDLEARRSEMSEDESYRERQKIEREAHERREEIEKQAAEERAGLARRRNRSRRRAIGGVISDVLQTVIKRK